MRAWWLALDRSTTATPVGADRGYDLGEALYRQIGTGRPSTERRLLIAVAVGFGIILVVLPISVRGMPTPLESLLWNALIRGLGAALIIFGVLALLGKELVAIHERGLILRTSFLDVSAGMLGRPPRAIRFEDIAQVVPNEGVEWPPATIRTRKGELRGRLLQDAEALITSQEGTLPMFAIEMKEGKEMVLGKANISDWEAFLEALDGRVKIDRNGYFLKG